MNKNVVIILISLLLLGCEKEKSEPDKSNKASGDIVFFDNFVSWSGGMSAGWTRLKNEGAILSEIAGGGIMFSGTTKCAWDIIGRVVSIPSGDYNFTIELFEPIGGTLSDHLNMRIDSQERTDALFVALSINTQTIKFSYKGSITRLRLDFANCKTPITPKVKSISIAIK